MLSKFDSINRQNILYLDVGNSILKAAHKKAHNWEVLYSGGWGDSTDFIQWFSSRPQKFSALVIASVKQDVIETLEKEVRSLPIKYISTNDIPREMLDYETPETLGIDRFLACYGATSLTEKAVVVIDAGTATTIDFMGTDDVFRGGLIAPGYYSFSKILKEKAPALPEVDHSIPDIWPGKSSKNSMKWGQAGFYKMAIENILKKHEDTFGDFDLFITGGDAEIIAKILDRELRVRPFLVFEGMERMAESTEIFNIEQ